jgi:hypothetical protein
MGKEPWWCGREKEVEKEIFFSAERERETERVRGLQ